jgi:hypothetical protein
MGIIYVSADATNGYVIGSDTNSGASKSLPKLTLEGAQSAATAGDTIMMNNSTFIPNNGPGYLSVTKSLTWMTDTSASSNAKWTSTGTRIVNWGVSSTIIGVDFDSNNIARTSGVCTIGSNAIVIFTNTKVLNTPSTGAYIAIGVNAVFIAEFITMKISDGNSSTSRLVSMNSAGGSCTLKGLTVDGIGYVLLGSNNVATALFRTQAASNGQRNAVKNINRGVIYGYGALHDQIDINDTDFDTVTTSCIFAGDPTEQVTLFNVRNCTFKNMTIDAISIYGNVDTYGALNIQNNSYSGVRSLYVSNGLGTKNCKISNNLINQTSATKEPIQIQYGTSGIEVYNNIINSDWTGRLIQLGTDGQVTLSSNVAATTTFVGLGNTTSKWVSQAVTFTNLTKKIPSSVRFKFNELGNPTGVVNCYLYSDDGSGKPSTLIATSEYTLNGSDVTGTDTWVEFWFDTHPSLTSGTVYHAVLKYTGPTDASNYIKVLSNATGTTGNTSIDGVTWSTGSSVLMFQLMAGSFEITNPKVYGNKLNHTGTISNLCHDVFIGAIRGGLIYQNETYNGGISLISKLADGSDTVNYPILIYDNVCFQGKSFQDQRMIFRDKGSRNVQCYQNTYVMNGNGSNASVAMIDNDYETSFTPQLNGQPSRNCKFYNNIVDGSNCSGNSYIYVIGSSTAAYPTVINPMIDDNLVNVGSGFIAARSYLLSSIPVNYNTFADWQNAGFDVGGYNDVSNINVNPPTKLTDFVPTWSSKAFGLGRDLSSIVPNDFYGNPFRLNIVGAFNAPYRNQIPIARTNIDPSSRTSTSSRTNIDPSVRIRTG